MADSCLTCKYFKPLQEIRSGGICRRNSPSPSRPDAGTPSQKEHIAWWPTVQMADWCGDWTATT
jgi:hypothetical protein